jgi:hypothetical protein
MQTIPDSKPHDKRHALCAPSNGIRHPFHTLMKIDNNPPIPFWLHPMRLVFMHGLALLCCLAQGQQQGVIADKAADPIVEMEPYVVRGDRILPKAESWNYIMVPGLELTRGSNVVLVPGFEILSSRGKKNTLLLVDELQLRQLASAILFPALVRAFPRAAVVVILDDNDKMRMKSKSPDVREWEGDSPFTSRALGSLGRYPDPHYAVGTATWLDPHGGLAERASDYRTNIDRMSPISNALDVQDRPFFPEEPDMEMDLEDVRRLTSMASSGGAITIYIDDSGRGQPVGSPPISEEKFAHAIWLGLNEYLLNTSIKNAPEWLRLGLSRLYASVNVSHQEIEFGQATFRTEEQSAPKEAMPRLRDVLKGDRPLSEISYGAVWASAFVHYCLLADKGRWTPKFFHFVGRLEKEPFSEGLFRECFNIKSSSMDAALGTYVRTFAWYKATRYVGTLPPMPEVIAREAAQAEVARLKAEVLVANGWTPKALDELRIAYWRGEREPVMLAMLAFLEEHIGSLSRAQKITKSLLAMPSPPARAYVVAAKLRLREITEGREESEKLGREDAESVMAMLSKALERGICDEDLCATLSNVILKSAEPPGEHIAAFIAGAAKRHALNASIAAAAALR